MRVLRGAAELREKKFGANFITWAAAKIHFCPFPECNRSECKKYVKTLEKKLELEMWAIFGGK
jgi:hypothetical protein